MAAGFVSSPGPRRPSLARRWRALGLAGAVAACGGELPRRAPVDDSARRSAPVPACIRATHAGAGRIRELDAWALLFPTFEAATRRLPEGARACTGADVLGDGRLAGETTEPPRPRTVAEGDMVLTAGPDGLTVVWAQTHRYPDGSRGGALALVRGAAGVAEAFAVAPLRGSPRLRLALERMGAEVVVTALEPGCDVRAAGTPCESMLTVYLLRRGALEAGARVATERVGYATPGEVDAIGPAEYHLATSLRFEAEGLIVAEQVRARDRVGRELRRAELVRRYVARGDHLYPQEEPLWSAVFPAR